jgi:hypothetical protein
MDQLEEKLEQQFAETNSVRKKEAFEAASHVHQPPNRASQPVSHVIFARAERVVRVLSIDLN